MSAIGVASYRRCPAPFAGGIGTHLATAVLAAALLLTLAGGCQQPVETRYGRTSGIGAGSVNGTRVLADMFADRGHKVDSFYQLSPKLLQADVIVWFPDDYEPPTTEVRDWLDNWLFTAADRTLIYVGRDYDAAPGYWKKIAHRVAPAEQQFVARQRKEAEVDVAVEQKKIPDVSDNEWFDISGKLDPRQVRELSGPWSEGIDAAKVEIELNGRLKPVDWAEALLESDNDVLVGRVSLDNWRGSKFITVANGSFLLNLPLVNHEHRKLAGRLISAVGPPRKRVVFLQSGPGGPEILDKEPEPPQFNALDILGVWPLGGVLLHLALLGVIFAFARWPIFGRPLVPPAPPASDFGKHVTALGQLLRGPGTASSRSRGSRSGTEERTRNSELGIRNRSPTRSRNHHEDSGALRIPNWAHTVHRDSIQLRTIQSPSCPIPMT